MLIILVIFMFISLGAVIFSILGTNLELFIYSTISLFYHFVFFYTVSKVNEHENKLDRLIKSEKLTRNIAQQSVSEVNKKGATKYSNADLKEAINNGVYSHLINQVIYMESFDKELMFIKVRSDDVIILVDEHNNEYQALIDEL